MELILNWVESFFIVWFVLICCGVKIMYSNKIQLFVLVTIQTFMNIMIQTFTIAQNQTVNMLIIMLIGIFLDAYLIKCFYFGEVKIVKVIMWTIFYFLFFMMMGETILINIFSGVVPREISEMTLQTRIMLNLFYRSFETIIFLALSFMIERKQYEKVF